MTNFDDLPQEIQDYIYVLAGRKWWIRHGPGNRLLSVVTPPRYDSNLARQYNVRVRRNYMADYVTLNTTFTLSGQATMKA